MNLTWITDRMAVGTTPENASDIIYLQEQGVTHAINCRSELDVGDLFMRTGITYLWNGTEDYDPLHPSHKPKAWFEMGVTFGLRILMAPWARLYVFCHEGACRSATMAWTILRAFGTKDNFCTLQIDQRPVAIAGLMLSGWRDDAEAALREMRYLDGSNTDSATK